MGKLDLTTFTRAGENLGLLALTDSETITATNLDTSLDNAWAYKDFTASYWNDGYIITSYVHMTSVACPSGTHMNFALLSNTNTKDYRAMFLADDNMMACRLMETAAGAKQAYLIAFNDDPDYDAAAYSAVAWKEENTYRAIIIRNGNVVTATIFDMTAGGVHFCTLVVTLAGQSDLRYMHTVSTADSNTAKGDADYYVGPVYEGRDYLFGLGQVGSGDVELAQVY